MRKALLLLPFLAGCVPATPIVSDYNGDSVTIQTSMLADQAEVKVNAQAEADRICAKKDKRAEYASSRQVAEYTNAHLFLCL
ncbi:hypothetical protein B6V74_02005 [Thioclava sp. F42-5]|uniref:hypothetical protein n=1 Tax=Thioclava sp. F42-5 TaxID=1973005 RepID=UPI000B53C828|nr:hypothetical protein [Thioclava sp. F42-5]OWY10824.1 hypothetical protein B6V74_02005 [Thioclava sp. F42-5]